MRILTYNISWECMTNSTLGSAGELGNICMQKSKNNFYCKNNFIHFLKDKFNNNILYDAISLQEASNLNDIHILLPELQNLNYKIFHSISNNEKMITIFNLNIFKIINFINGEFKSGRPLQIFILKNLNTNENIIYVNLHYCTLNKDFNSCGNLTNILTDYLKKIEINYYKLYQNYRIILTGDFNHDININYSNKYNLIENENKLIFKPFKNLNLVQTINPLKTCCYKKTFNSKIEFNSDLIMDSKTICKNYLVKIPLFLNEISDHLPVEALL